jgi:hypothetical protein
MKHFAFALVGIILVACGAGATAVPLQEIQATATNVPAITATFEEIVLPSNTPAPTATPGSTSTPRPSITPITPQPTRTETALPAATATSVPPTIAPTQPPLATATAAPPTQPPLPTEAPTQVPLPTQEPPTQPPANLGYTCPNGERCIKGNINSEGKHLYHYPGCPSYNQTEIDESKGERWFNNEAEAQAAGWTKAGNC